MFEPDDAAPDEAKSELRPPAQDHGCMVHGQDNTFLPTHRTYPLQDGFNR